MNRAQIIAILATAGASLTGPVTAKTIELSHAIRSGDVVLAQAKLNHCLRAGEIQCCSDGSGAVQNGNLCRSPLWFSSYAG